MFKPRALIANCCTHQLSPRTVPRSQGMPEPANPTKSCVFLYIPIMKFNL